MRSLLFLLFFAFAGCGSSSELAIRTAEATYALRVLPAERNRAFEAHIELQMKTEKLEPKEVLIKTHSLPFEWQQNGSLLTIDLYLYPDMAHHGEMVRLAQSEEALPLEIRFDQGRVVQLKLVPIQDSTQQRM